MTNDYWARASAPHADRDCSEREPSTDPAADVAEPEHRMVPPDASDLRWRCSGCRWTASDAFTSPEHRMVMWAKAHPEPTPERGDEDRVGVALVGEYAEVLDMWLPRYLRRIWTEHGEARDVIEAIEVLIEQGLASACVQVENRHTAELEAEVARLREDAEGQHRVEWHGPGCAMTKGYAATCMCRPRTAGVIDAAHLERQRQWSAATFGPGPRTAGVIDHIRRELAEVEAAPDDLGEWVDLVILGFDGAWRAGHEPQTIIDAVIAKQVRNESRTWPDWRTADPGKAIEHIRTEPTPQDAS